LFLVIGFCLSGSIEVVAQLIFGAERIMEIGTSVCDSLEIVYYETDKGDFNKFIINK